MDNSESKRNHKRDSYGAEGTRKDQTPISRDDNEKSASFTVGSTAKKRLDMEAVNAATGGSNPSGRKKKVAQFRRLGNLSPTKKAKEKKDEVPAERKKVSVSNKCSMLASFS